MIYSIASFLAGITALAKGKGKSVFVILTTMIGFMITAFVIGELLFPHKTVCEKIDQGISLSTRNSADYRASAPVYKHEDASFVITGR